MYDVNTEPEKCKNAFYLDGVIFKLSELKQGNYGPFFNFTVKQNEHTKSGKNKQRFFNVSAFGDRFVPVLERLKEGSFVDLVLKVEPSSKEIDGKKQYFTNFNLMQIEVK